MDALFLAVARLLVATAIVAAAPVRADTVIAARMIPAQSVLEADDLAMRAEPHSGALSDATSAVGMEAKVNIYAGRPIRAEDLTRPAIIDRNQIVKLNYFHAGLVIATEGRALDRAGPGTRVRVMNLTSRSTVIGTVMVDGSVNVAPTTH